MAQSVSVEIDLKVSPQKLWGAIRDSASLFPKIMPSHFKSIEVIGDGNVGTIRKITYGEVSSPLTASPSPSPAATSIAKSPAASISPSGLPPATTGGVLSPSASHEGSTGSANAGSMMSFSMSSMLILGIMNVIAARIIM